MTFTTNIPVTSDSLGGTRDRIRTNFVQIAAVEAVNHVAFNALGEGKHKFLQMPETTASGSGIPATAANEGGVYVDVGTSPAQSNLFFRGESNGFSYQLTRAISASTGRFGNNTAYAANHTGGWTFLAGNATDGGLIIQYGARTSPGSSGTITFPVAFTTGYYSITIGVSRNNSSSTQNVYIDNSVAPSLSSFSYDSTSSGNDPIYWMAIGL